MIAELVQELVQRSLLGSVKCNADSRVFSRWAHSISAVSHCRAARSLLRCDVGNLTKYYNRQFKNNMLSICFHI